MKTPPIAIPNFTEKAPQKAGTYTYTMSMWEPPRHWCLTAKLKSCRLWLNWSHISFFMHKVYIFCMIYCFVICMLHFTPATITAASDTSRPVVSGCPGNFVERAEPGTTAADVSWIEPTATDNSGTVFTTSTHSPPTILPVGSTSITYTFTDPSGNQNTCTFIVTVICKLLNFFLSLA